MLDSLKKGHTTLKLFPSMKHGLIAFLVINLYTSGRSNPLCIDDIAVPVLGTNLTTREQQLTEEE